MLYAAENEKVVGVQPFERDLGDAIDRIPSLRLSRRQSDRVLPSIEDTSQGVQDQSTFLKEHAEPASPSFQNQNALRRARGPVPKAVPLDKDRNQRNTKRRRVDGFTSLSREETPPMELSYEARRPILVPLRDEGEYPISSWQPTRPVFDTGKEALDKEGLHPGVAGANDFDRQRPTHVIHTSDPAPSQRQYVVDADERKYASREHFQIQLSRTGTGQQAEFFSKPLHAQPDLRQSFPTSRALNKHVSLSYGATDPYVSFRHIDNFSAGGDGRLEGSNLVRTVPSRVKEPEKVTHDRLRALEDRPRTNGQYVAKYSDGATMRRVGFEDSPHGEGNCDAYKNLREDFLAQPQLGYHDNARLGPQDLEPRREVYSLNTRPTAHFISKDEHLGMYNNMLSRWDERHVRRPLPRSHEPRRYDPHSRYSIRFYRYSPFRSELTLHDSRNQYARRPEQSSHGVYRSVLPTAFLEPQKARDGRMVYPINEDRHQILQDPKMQREIVVLD